MRAVTFQVKDMCFQRGFKYSRKTRFPGLGARGRISSAGTAARVAKQAAKAVPVTQKTAAPTEKREMPG